MNSGTSIKIVLGLVGAGAVAGGAWFALRSSDAASGPRAMLKLLPADTTAALIVPDGAKALGGLKALKDRFQGKIKAIEPLIGEGSRLVGFDLNKPETMAEIGLRPGGGFATAAGADWAALVFAVEDEAKFERFVKKRFEAETGGELTWKSIDREGVSVRMARTGGADGTDVFGLTYLRGHAIVAPTRNWEGETVDPAGSLLKVSRTTEETSLASRADLMGPLEEVGYDLGAILLTDLAKGAEIAAVVAADRQRPRDAEALRRAGKQVQGLAVGIGVDSRGLRLSFAMSGPPEAVKALQAAFKPSAAGPDYAKVAPPDGLLLLSVAFNPTGIMPWLREQLMDYERKVIDKTLAASTELSGTDFEKELLPLLSGHVGFVFQNLDVATIGQRLLKNLGASTTVAMEEPGAITTTTFVGLKDGPAMTALIEKAVAAAKEKAGGELPGFERVEGKAAWRLRQDETEVVGFAVQGKTLVLTTGVDKLDAAMARLSGGDKAGKSLGDRVMVAEAKAALSPENNLALFISVPVLFSNYPLLNLWPPAAPAKLLAEAVVMARVSSVGIKGEVLVTLPPPPPPEPGAKK